MSGLLGRLGLSRRLSWLAAMRGFGFEAVPLILARVLPSICGPLVWLRLAVLDCQLVHQGGGLQGFPSSRREFDLQEDNPFFLLGVFVVPMFLASFVA